DFPLRPVRRDQVRKWGVVPLGEWVQGRLHMRVYRTAWNFFKRPYQPELHRERFIAFLNQLTQEHTASTRQIAQLFAELLEPPEPITQADYIAQADRRSAWLRAFLQDVPEWDARLRTWIARTQR